MRKLILFSALGGAFLLALGLERLVARAQPDGKVAAASDRVVLQLGGGPPRAIPASPLDEPEPRPDGVDGSKSKLRKVREEAGVPPKPAPRPKADPRTCVVGRHETLSTIARRELGSSSRWRDLAAWNAIADPTTLKEGTVLKLEPSDAEAQPPRTTTRAPAAEGPRTHKVAKGETLSRIAARYLGDAQRWREIQSLNGISDPANVSEGTTLKIPER